jgi:YgiT-type zinc finger domain-containing protein
MGAAGAQQEEEAMKCRVCGGVQQRIETDLPFKTGDRTIVVMKGIPAHQCGRCAEYSLDDPTVARVDELLARVGASTELEVISFAA